MFLIGEVPLSSSSVNFRVWVGIYHAAPFTSNPAPCTLHTTPSMYTRHPIPRTLHHIPYTRHPTPYTLYPTPYTLHPTPYTLHPTPYTLHPTPYTLYPTPCTLHPIPYALHRIPYTLNLTPYAPYPTPSTLHPTPGTPHPIPYILHRKTGSKNISQILPSKPCILHPTPYTIIPSLTSTQLTFTPHLCSVKARRSVRVPPRLHWRPLCSLARTGRGDVLSMRRGILQGLQRHGAIWRERRERETRERHEVMSPSPSTRPYTWQYWGGMIKSVHTRVLLRILRV